MDIKSLDALVSGVLIAFGLYLVWSGFDFGFIRGTTPGPGLFPVLIGVVMAMLSAVNLARSVTGREILEAGMSGEDIGKVAALLVVLVGVILLTDFVGIALASVILIVCASLVIRRNVDTAQIIRVAGVAITVPFACRWLFGDVLGVPIPTGPFGI